MHYFCHFIAIGLEMSHVAMSFSVFDKLRNTKLLQYNYIQDPTYLCGLYSIIQVYPFNSHDSSFSAAILSWSMSSDDFVLWDLLANASTITGGGVSAVDCINVGLYWGSWACSPILFLSCCWGLNKGDGSVRRTFIRGISKCLLE